jgi:hypothetical protein
VLELAARMGNEVGRALVTVDANPEAVAFYTKYGFTPFESLEGESNARPQPTAMYLMMADVEAAAKSMH